MTTLLLAAGALAGTILIALLGLTLSGKGLRIWPTPGKGSWQSLLFWSLFRALNLTAIALAAVDWGELNLVPFPLRLVSLAVAAVCAALYVSSLLSLGPTNTYCRRAGLVDRGIYRWTRNPQYATVIPTFLALAIAADSAAAFGVIALLVTVYVMMAYAEEPWLKAAYPGVYDRYARRVPRFYNWRRTRAFLRLGRRQLPLLPRHLTAPAVRHLAATTMLRKRD